MALTIPASNDHLSLTAQVATRVSENRIGQPVAQTDVGLVATA